MFEIEKIASELANDNLQGFEIERIAKALNGDGQGFEIERIAESVNGGSGGGNSGLLKSVINRTVTYIEDDITEIGDYAFGKCLFLKSVVFPECT